MLYFVGLGIDQSLSLKAIEVLRACENIFFEGYTSPQVNEELLSQFYREGLKMEVVKREFVEDGRKILETSKRAGSALISSGDPMVATTHQELRARAIKEGIETRILHGSSILSSVSGELGLHTYNFGRVVTIKGTNAVYGVQHHLRQFTSRVAHYDPVGVGRISKLLSGS